MVIAMDIDFNKIEKIYGRSVIESLSILRDDVIKNIEYFMSLGFDDVIDIFESSTTLFRFIKCIISCNKKCFNIIFNFRRNYREKRIYRVYW